jgi:hypothetical protein
MQIAEKKYKKDMEKQREQEDIMREENRLRNDQEKLKQAYEELGGFLLKMLRNCVW